MIEDKKRLSRWASLEFPEGTPAEDARALVTQIRRDGWRVHREDGVCLVISEVPTSANPLAALMTARESAPVNPAGLSALAEVVQDVRAWDSGWRARFPAGMQRLTFPGAKPTDSRLLAYPLPQAPRSAPPRPGVLPFRGAPTHPEAPPAPPAIAALDFLGGESMRSGRGVNHEARLVVHVLGNLSATARKGGALTPQYFSAGGAVAVAVLGVVADAEAVAGHHGPSPPTTRSATPSRIGTPPT